MNFSQFFGFVRCLFILPWVLFGSASAVAAPPITEPVDVNVINPVDVNVTAQPDQSIDSLDFAAWPVACSSDDFSPCTSDRTIEGEGFLLHYVHFRVIGTESSPSRGCLGDVRIGVVQPDLSVKGWDLLELTTEPNSVAFETLALPVPIRLNAGDEIVAGANNAPGGVACRVRAIFGGEQL